MTSWLKVPLKKKDEGPVKLRPYFISLQEDEFCSHFNTLFYSQLYAKTNVRDLIVYDMSTVISPSFSLLQETFAPVKGVEYASEMKPSVNIIRPKDGQRYGPVISALSQPDLRSAARAVLTWNQKTLEKIQASLEENRLDGDYDVGVHIRSPVRFDRVRAPAIQTYVDAVQGVADKLKKNDLTVFVMVDDLSQFESFAKAAPKTWVLSAVRPRNSLVRGGRVGTMNRQNSGTKLAAYVEFLTELYCMQRSKNVICNLSNDTGRFLYLTAEADSLRSLDTPAWTPF
jgi:hypothetical protein